MSKTDTAKSHYYGAHDSCTCDYCGLENFDMYRYKCLECENYDLCAYCFEKRKLSKSKGRHETGHPMVRFDMPFELFGTRIENNRINLESFSKEFEQQNHEIDCTKCANFYPIKGLRFNCDTCQNYDLCLKCFKEKKMSGSHLLMHPLVVYGKTIATNNIDIREVKKIEKLDSGNFGTVYKAKYKNKWVALKEIKGDLQADNDKKRFEKLKNKQRSNDSFNAESQAYERIKGAYIVRMIGHDVMDDNNTFCFSILMELMNRGNLKRLLKDEPNLSNRRRLSMAFHISVGMSRIHDMGFIHGDIRPDNIFISDSYVAKIGDFGIARLKDGDYHSLGHEPYMPPEFFNKVNTKEKLDIFTFGLTLNELFDGEHLQSSKDTKQVTFRKLSPFCSDLIENCVDVNPDKRPNSEEIESKLKNFQDVLNRFFEGRIGKSYKKTKGKQNSVFKTFNDRLFKQPVNSSCDEFQITYNHNITNYFWECVESYWNDFESIGYEYAAICCFSIVFLTLCYFYMKAVYII